MQQSESRVPTVLPGLSGGKGHVLSLRAAWREERAGISPLLGGRCSRLDPEKVSLTLSSLSCLVSMAVRWAKGAALRPQATLRSFRLSL